MKKLFLYLGLLCIPMLLHATDMGPYRIGSLQTSIDGWSREAFLLNFLAIDTEREFSDLEDLENYLAGKEQKLHNKRLFVDIAISYQTIPDIPGAVEVLVHVSDGSPYLLFPYYKYNSNYGHQFGAVNFFYNVFGTLTNIELGAGFSTTSFGSDPWKRVNWDITLEWTGLDLFNFSWDTAFRQDFKTVEQRDYDTDDILLFYTYNQSSLSIGTRRSLYRTLGYRFRPSINWKYAYDPRVGEIDDSLKMSAGLRHNLDYGQVNWIANNARDGYALDLGQDFSYDFFNQKLYNEISAEFSYFTSLWIFQLSTRGLMRYNLLEDSINTGGALRGILNNRLSGQFRYVENFDISTYFFTIPKLMDVRGGAFLDIGFMKRQGYPMDKPYFTAGIEGLFFPLRFRGLTLRGTFGMDLRALAQGDFSRWELDISQHLFY